MAAGAGFLAGSRFDGEGTGLGAVVLAAADEVRVRAIADLVSAGHQFVRKVLVCAGLPLVNPPGALSFGSVRR